MTADELLALRVSLWVALCATCAGFLPALLVARWLARTPHRKLALVVESLVVLPLVVPPVVVGYLLLVVFGRGSVVGGMFDAIGIPLAFHWVGAALAAMLLGLPLMVRGMRQAFEAVDPALEEAARTLGASRWRIARTITWPLAARGCIAGATLCFARSLGEFGATITFAGNIEGETRTLPLSIWTALQRVDGEAAAWRMTWLCIGLSLAATLGSELLLASARWRDRRPNRAEAME